MTHTQTNHQGESMKASEVLTHAQAVTDLLDKADLTASEKGAVLKTAAEAQGADWDAVELYTGPSAADLLRERALHFSVECGSSNTGAGESKA